MSDEPKERKQLGKILLKQKAVSANDLEEIISRHKADGTRIASAALASGKVDEVALLTALSEQHGVPGIDLSQLVIPLEHLRMIPAEIARQHCILPFAVKENEVWLAMSDPQAKRVIDELEFVMGLTVQPYVALHEQLKTHVNLAYKALAEGEVVLIGARVPDSYLAQAGLTRPQHGANAAGQIAGWTPSEPPPAPHEGGSSVAKPPAPPSIPQAHAPASHEGSGRMRAPLPPTPSPTAQTIDAAFSSKVAALPTENPARAPQSTKRILVADAEEDLRKMLRRTLQEKGYEVHEATRGSEALHQLRKTGFDLVLLDAFLPEIAGFEFCRRVRSNDPLVNLPIVLTSSEHRGWRVEDDLRESFGNTLLLAKPFKVSEVISTLHRALSGETFDPMSIEEQLGADARALLDLGMQAYRNGNIDQAIEHLVRATSIEPNSFRLPYHLGLLFGRKDEVWQAIQNLEQALLHRPRSFPALKNVAILLGRVGFRARATEYWERALRVAPDDETRESIKQQIIELL